MSHPKVLTAMELARVMSSLSGRTMSARRVRHLLVECALGTELQGRQHGQTRLFGLLDLAIIRLVVELEAQGISAWVSRVVLTYLRDDIVRAFRSSAPVALSVRGLRATLEPALKGRPSAAVAWVPLRDVWKGLEGAILATRAQKPTVWMWSEVPPQSVKRSTLI